MRCGCCRAACPEAKLKCAPHISANPDQLETHLAQILGSLDFC